jgi:putative hydrolase of the HAD superfamily
MVDKKEGIKAIIFDIGGVLISGGLLKKLKRGHESGVHEYMAKKLKVTIDQYFDAIDTAYALSIENKAPKKKILSIMAKNLKTTSSKLEKLYFKAYKRHFKKNKKLFKLAFKLKKQGYKIAILSDQWQVSQELFVSNKMRKKFDVVIISSEVGMRKPDPKIYKLTLKKLKLPAKQTVFVDNQKWNIVPAKKLGMKTILYKDVEQTKKALEKLGIK